MAPGNGGGRVRSAPEIVKLKPKSRIKKIKIPAPAPKTLPLTGFPQTSAPAGIANSQNF